MKTSGSKRRYVVNGSFSEERNRKKQGDIESHPHRESFKRSTRLYNGKINYGLLVRFLYTQVGMDWDSVYSEIISRIPTKLLPYKDMVFWFVADKAEIIEGRIWNKKTHKFIRTQSDWLYGSDSRRFYVCPQTNVLIKVPDVPKRRPEKTTGA